MFDEGCVEAGNGPGDPRNLVRLPGWELEGTGLMHASLLYLRSTWTRPLGPFLSSGAQRADQSWTVACSRDDLLGPALKGTVWWVAAPGRWAGPRQAQAALGLQSAEGVLVGYPASHA